MEIVQGEDKAQVHGDIRRLENKKFVALQIQFVHGDIRRLEILGTNNACGVFVHGDIRRLENISA